MFYFMVVALRSSYHIKIFNNYLLPYKSLKVEVRKVNDLLLLLSLYLIFAFAVFV